MPLIGTSPWTDAANLGSGLGQGIGNLLMGMPALRARQLQAAADMMVAQAQQQELGARAGLYGAQTQQTQQDTTNSAAQASALPQVLAALIAKNQPGAAAATGPFGYNAKDPSALISGLAAVLNPGANLTQPGNAGSALQVQGVRPTVVPQNSTAFLGDQVMRGQGVSGPGDIVTAPQFGIGQPSVERTNPNTSATSRMPQEQLDTQMLNAWGRANAGMIPEDSPITRALIARISQTLGVANPPAPQMPFGWMRPQQTNAPAQVNSQQDYDALPSGAVFIDSSGQAKRKQ